MATDVARLALQIDVTGAQRAKQALDGLQDGSVKATRATNQLTASTTRMAAVTRRTSGAFRIQKGAIQQVGFQVGDFATQVSAGQSAMVAFGQQASQLAQVMGPGGALLGAVIAIGAGIGGALIRSLGGASESTEDLTEKTRELVKELGRATDRQREFINIGFQQEILSQERAVKQAEETIAEMNARIEDFRRAAGENVPDAVFNSNSAVQSLRQNIDDARLAIDNANSSAEATAKSQKEFWEAVEESGEKTKDTTDKIREMVEAAEQQAATIGLSARATATYEAALAGANAEQIQAIDAAYRRVEAHKQEVAQQKALQEQYNITAANDPLLNRVSAQGRGEGIIEGIRQEAVAVRNGLDQEFAIRQAHKERVVALNDALRLGVISSTEERNRLEIESMRQRNEQLRQIEMQKYQVLNSGQEAFLSATSNLFGNLASIAEKGGKDQFNTWKAMASAQAAVSTALAVANALTAAPPPINFALAASVGALGAVQIAQIQSQEYQGSYLGGGYTGQGSRSGGVDGKGGFPAILHPNETVIDHEAGQRNNSNTNNANVTQVFQLSDNARREAKQQILESAPMIQQMAKQAVLQAINQGGPMSRAVGRRS